MMAPAANSSSSACSTDTGSPTLPIDTARAPPVSPRSSSFSEQRAVSIIPGSDSPAPTSQPPLVTSSESRTSQSPTVSTACQDSRLAVENVREYMESFYLRTATVYHASKETITGILVYINWEAGFIHLRNANIDVSRVWTFEKPSGVTTFFAPMANIRISEIERIIVDDSFGGREIYIDSQMMSQASNMRHSVETVSISTGSIPRSTNGSVLRNGHTGIHTLESSSDSSSASRTTTLQPLSTSLPTPPTASTHRNQSSSGESSGAPSSPNEEGPRRSIHRNAPYQPSESICPENDLTGQCAPSNHPAYQNSSKLQELNNRLLVRKGLVLAMEQEIAAERKKLARELSRIATVGTNNRTGIPNLLKEKTPASHLRDESSQHDRSDTERDQSVIEFQRSGSAESSILDLLDHDGSSGCNSISSEPGTSSTPIFTGNTSIIRMPATKHGALDGVIRKDNDKVIRTISMGVKRAGAITQNQAKIRRIEQSTSNQSNLLAIDNVFSSHHLDDCHAFFYAPSLSTEIFE